MILFSPLTNLLYLIDSEKGKKKYTLNTHELLNTAIDMLAMKHKVSKKELNICVDDSHGIKVTRYKDGVFTTLEIINR